LSNRLSRFYFSGFLFCHDVWYKLLLLPLNDIKYIRLSWWLLTPTLSLPPSLQEMRTIPISLGEVEEETLKTSNDRQMWFFSYHFFNKDRRWKINANKRLDIPIHRSFLDISEQGWPLAFCNNKFGLSQGNKQFGN